MTSSLLLFWPLLLCLAAAPASAVTGAQTDDFEDGTTQGWMEGVLSPNPPINVPAGGPAGVGDGYLENLSDGGLLAGGRQVVFNRAQWAGDYLAAQVISLEMDLVNLGASELSIRIALEGAFGERYGSTTAFPLPADGAWHHASFGLAGGELAQIIGLAPLETVLAGVTELRILSAAAGPVWEGDIVVSTLGVDNVTTVSLTVPALQPWARVAFVALLGLALVHIVRRSRALPRRL